MNLFDEAFFEGRDPIVCLDAMKFVLFEELDEIGQAQKDKAAEIRKVEKRAKEELENVTEHIAEAPLSHQDVERWVRSVHWQYARTNPQNPHQYAHTRWCDRDMFERVVLHIREHGYSQPYGGADYICYDVADSFIWSMGSPLEDTVLINRKPASMKPGKE